MVPTPACQRARSAAAITADASIAGTPCECDKDGEVRIRRTPQSLDAGAEESDCRAVERCGEVEDAVVDGDDEIGVPHGADDLGKRESAPKVDDARMTDEAVVDGTAVVLARLAPRIGAEKPTGASSASTTASQLSSGQILSARDPPVETRTAGVSLGGARVGSA